MTEGRGQKDMVDKGLVVGTSTRFAVLVILCHHDPILSIVLTNYTRIIQFRE